MHPVASASKWRRETVECPYSSGLKEENSRPELYGLLSREIDDVLDYSHDAYLQTGRLLDKDPRDFTPTLGEQDLQRCDSQIAKQCQNAWSSAMEISTIQPEVITSHLERKARINELLEESSYLDPEVETDNVTQRIISGTNTASVQIVDLLVAMNDFLRDSPATIEERQSLIARSTQPIGRLAKTDIITISNLIIPAHSTETMFQLSASGRLTFSEDFKVTLKKQEEDNERSLSPALKPRIGCPILLSPKQLQKAWEWGGDIVGKAGLFHDYQGRM